MKKIALAGLATAALVFASVAMTKTERWYAIVEELRASATRLCS
jgi:hypothetical protein